MKTKYILLITFLLLMNMVQPQRILCQAQNVGKARDIFKSKQKVVSNIDSFALLKNRAYQFSYSGNLDSAIYYGIETLNFCRSHFNGDNPDLALSINNMAYFYNERGNYNEAEPLYLEALQMRRRLFKGDNSALALSISNMAYFYIERGNYKEGEPLCQEALEMRRRLYKYDHLDLATSINNMASLYNKRGNYNKAEPLYIEALEMDRRLFNVDNPNLAVSINNMASFYNNRGSSIEAESLYKEALEMNRRLFKSDHPNLASIINNMGIFYQQRGKIKEAEILYEEALQIRRRLYKNDQPELAKSITAMAMFYDELGNFKKSELLFKEALNMNRRIYKGDHPDLATSINYLAVYYFGRGNYNEAESLYNEALAMNRNLYIEDHPDLASSINNMGIFYQQCGNTREAESLYKEALEMRKRIYERDHPLLAISINNLALLYDEQGNYKEAESLFKEALQMKRRLIKGDKLSLAIGINNMASFYNEKNKFSEAEPFYIELNNIYKNYFINNITYMSEKEKELFWNNINYHFTIFNSFVLKYNSIKPDISCYSYDNCLFTKAIILSNTKRVRDLILNSKDKELINRFKIWIDTKEYLVRLYSKTKQELESLGINLDSLEQSANVIEKELSLKSELFAKEYEKRKVTWQDVQAKLKVDEAAIEIVRFNYYDKNWTDTVYYAALIVTNDTKEHPELVLIKNGNELDSVYLGEYNTVIERQGNGTISKEESNKTMGELYEQFWKPIAEKLKGIKKVYLSLDGAYNQINLETLINPVTKEYLFEEIELHLLTSTRDLVLASNNKPNTKNVADLFGRPNYKLNEESRQKLAMNLKAGEKQYFSDNLMRDLTRLNVNDLPGTETEVRKISKLMQDNGWTVKTFVGDSALEEVIKSIDSPRILHIATHGYFLSDLELNKQYERGQITTKAFGIETYKAYENPLLRSGLLFAGAEKGLDTNYTATTSTDNGILTAYEAMNLNLDNTELVVLSACKTGLGQLRNGEGVYGLQRAFIVAGAKAIIMSLWNVPDAATQELMTSFYTKWLSGMSKREAFKSAQSEIRAIYKFPYYWGAFVMVGE